MNNSLAFINVNLDPLKTRVRAHTDLALRVFYTRHDIIDCKHSSFLTVELDTQPTAPIWVDIPESLEKTKQQHITVSVSAFSLWFSFVTKPTGKEP